MADDCSQSADHQQKGNSPGAGIGKAERPHQVEGQKAFEEIGGEGDESPVAAHDRQTLVAPILPLPCWRISMPRNWPSR